MGMDRRRYQLIPATKIRSKPLSQEAAEALELFALTYVKLKGRDTNVDNRRGVTMRLRVGVLKKAYEAWERLMDEGAIQPHEGESHDEENCFRVGD